MNTSPGIPKQIEELLITNRRGLLGNAGVFAVTTWSAIKGNRL